MKIVQPVQTGTESGHIVYEGTNATLNGEAPGRLLGFIRDDIMRGPLYQILGGYILLRPLRVPVTEFRRLCRMPGVGRVERQ